MTPDTPAPIGSLANGAHRPRGVLPDAEPDAAGRGAAPRRLGPRRADDPARDAPRSGEGLPRPRLPRAQHQAGDVALQALAAGARLAAELRRHRRRAGGPVPAVRHRHGRGRRPGHRGEVRARAARTPTRGLRRRPTRTRRAPRATCATPSTIRPRRSSTRRRSAATWSRPTGASRRTPTPSTCRASGCSSRTWRSSTTSASATPGTRAGRPRAGRSGGAVDEHAGPDEHRAQRRGDAGEAAGQHDRPDDRPDAVHAGPPQWVPVAEARASGWASTCRWRRSTSCSSTSSTSCAGRSCASCRTRPGRATAPELPLPVLREQLRRALAALHRRLRLRHPQGHPLRLGPRHPLPRRRRRPSR